VAGLSPIGGDLNPVSLNPVSPIITQGGPLEELILVGFMLGAGGDNIAPPQKGLNKDYKA
jgi:hypothetical protein